AVVLPATALHLELRNGADAHRLFAIGRHAAAQQATTRQAKRERRHCISAASTRNAERRHHDWLVGAAPARAGAGAVGSFQALALRSASPVRNAALTWRNIRDDKALCNFASAGGKTTLVGGLRAEATPCSVS